MNKKYLVILLVLAGCSPEPVIKTVKKNQNYTLPKAFKATGLKASLPLAHQLCGKGTEGCLKHNEDGTYTIIYTAPNVLVHEAEHLAYGPKHN